MSRQSQAFAFGVPKFTWEVNKVEDRYRCRCENHPAVEGWGQTEQEAIQNAVVAIRDAAEKAEI